MPKTAGNSIWREFLRRRGLIDSHLNYIANDTYHLSCKRAVEESPHLGHKALFSRKRSYPAERSANLPKIMREILSNVCHKFSSNHDIAIHHHDARSLQLLLNFEQLELVRKLRSMLAFSSDINNFASSEAWDPEKFRTSFVFSLRDPYERTRSHLAHIKRSYVTPIEAVHYEPSVYPSFSDFNVVSSENYDLASFLDEFPQLLSYQKRYLVSSFTSCCFEEESYVLWSAPAEVIDDCYAALSGASIQSSACILRSGNFSIIPILGSSAADCGMDNIGDMDIFPGTKSYSVLQKDLAFDTTLPSRAMSAFEDPFKF